MKNNVLNRYDSRARSLLKSISWRIFGSVITALGAFFLTHSISLSVYISIGEFFAKIILFYCHERIWQNISFGAAIPKITENAKF